MSFNDVNIVYYMILSIFGLFVGEFTNWMIKRLKDEKRVISLDIIKEYKKEFNPNYILMIVTSLIYIGILYICGIQSTILANLDLIKYLILTPMLISVVIIDYQLQIIPNRLTLTMFEIGIVITFLYGLSDVAISFDMILGMLAGGGIFLLITFLGGLVYGKEAMGLGDVKLMGALFFGLTNIIFVALISFLVGAILSIILLVTKIKKIDEYIPFGPFIVIAVFIVIFVPYDILKIALLNIFTLGLYSRNN